MPHEFRELVVDFGNGAYLVLYRTDGDVIVLVLSVTAEKLVNNALHVTRGLQFSCGG